MCIGACHLEYVVYLIEHSNSRRHRNVKKDHKDPAATATTSLCTFATSTGDTAVWLVPHPTMVIFDDDPFKLSTRPLHRENISRNIPLSDSTLNSALNVDGQLDCVLTGLSTRATTVFWLECPRESA